MEGSHNTQGYMHVHVAEVTLQEWKVVTTHTGGYFTGIGGSYDTQGYMHVHVAGVTLQESEVVTTHRGTCMCM